MNQGPADPEKRRSSVEWPTIVDDRLRLLVDLTQQADDLDKSTSANELLAALICSQSLDGARLARLVKRYRNRPLTKIAEETEEYGGAPPPRRGRPRSGSQRDGVGKSTR